MKKLLSLLILFASYGCDPKPAIDKEALTQELERIYQDDQKYRAELSAGQNTYAWASGEMKALRAKQHALDSANLERIIQIIEQVGGYPGTSLVGHPANEAAFYVLQHAPEDVQEKYYDIITQAADKNELNKRLVAMYRDRYLMNRGEPQIYGTQVFMVHKTDPATGAKIDSLYVWPIADTTNIDSVRMWNGLEPLEDYLNSFGLTRWR